MHYYAFERDRAREEMRYLPEELHEYTLAGSVSSFLGGEIWARYLQLSADDLPFGESHLAKLKEEFYEYSTNAVYHLIEFIARNFPNLEEVEEVEDEDEQENQEVLRVHIVDEVYPQVDSSEMPTADQLIEKINRVLEEERSGYRFIASSISPVNAPEEVKELENAFNAPVPVSKLFHRALELHSQRAQRGIYRNSIKESISAVESISNLITEKKNTSLGQALPRLEEKLGFKLHGAKRQALLSLYGWASDEARHGLLDCRESHLTQEDARFALIVCSAFVNYLKTKAANAEIYLDSST